MSVDKQTCPIVRFDAFQDAGCTQPWTDIASISLLNQTIPEQAYLNVTTWETLYYNLIKQQMPTSLTWVRSIYVRATTLGGKTSSPVQIRITIAKTVSKVQVNHAPQFVAPLEPLAVGVWERDLALNRSPLYFYWSPKAVDAEGDQIFMEFRGVEAYPYLRVT